jgi:hypothetical protein
VFAEKEPLGCVSDHIGLRPAVPDTYRVIASRTAGTITRYSRARDSSTWSVMR